MNSLEEEIKYLREIIEGQRKLIELLIKEKQNWYPPPQYPWLDPYQEEPYRPMKIWYSNGTDNLNQRNYL